jgi:hypothetical protein
MNSNQSTQSNRASRFTNRLRNRGLRLAALVCVSSFIFASCSKQSDESDKSITTGNASVPSAQGNLPPVEVPAEGKKFDPPVRAQQLPAGAWYCDMGTVHWAQMNEANHVCPFCKMDLKQKK